MAMKRYWPLFLAATLLAGGVLAVNRSERHAALITALLEDGTNGEVWTKDTAEIGRGKWETAGGGGAPVGAVYVVGAADATLSAERVVTDTSSITWDQTTPAQMKANVAAAGITNTMLADDIIGTTKYQDDSIQAVHLDFVVAPGIGDDEFCVTYEHSTGNFELVACGGGSGLTHPQVMSRANFSF